MSNTNWKISPRLMALMFAGKPANLMIQQLTITLTKSKTKGKFGVKLALRDVDGDAITEMAPDEQFAPDIAEYVITINGINRAFEFKVQT